MWLDQIDIKPGSLWDNTIERALAEASQMILILTPSSAKSENVRDEISFALHHRKIILPVMLQDCEVPLRLQRQQRIDFRSDYEHGLAALLENLRSDAPPAPGPATPPPSRASIQVAPIPDPPSPPRPVAKTPPEAVVPPEQGWEYESESPMAFDEIGRLEHLGQAGWEMVGFVEGTIKFRRTLDTRLHIVWQYHRVAGTLSPTKRGNLERNGWTSVGTWADVFHYFKRQAMN